MTHQLTEQITQDIKAKVTSFFGSIFEQLPDLLGIRFTQYTPSFNDGEPCTNTIASGKLHFLVEKSEKYKEYLYTDEDEDEDAFEDDCEDDCEQPIKTENKDHMCVHYCEHDHMKDPGYGAQFKDVEGFLDSSDEILGIIFPTNSTITIKRDGTVVTEDYECGW